VLLETDSTTFLPPCIPVELVANHMPDDLLKTFAASPPAIYKISLSDVFFLQQYLG